MDWTTLEHEICSDEGLRLRAYKCTAGKLTIGYGHKLTPSEIKAGMTEISAAKAGELLHQDLGFAVAGCNQIFGRERFEGFSDARQRALVNMVYQMGATGVLGFRRMIDSIMHEDWNGASSNALDSKWARLDTPSRAQRVAGMLRRG